MEKKFNVNSSMETAVDEDVVQSFLYDIVSCCLQVANSYYLILCLVTAFPQLKTSFGTNIPGEFT